MNTQLPKHQHHQTPGFTIVELLIVIVVIGILAAISIIAYNNINTKAAEASLQSDLTNASKQLGMIHAEEGNYPSSLPSDAKATNGNTFHYDQLSSGTGYCLTAVSTSSSSAKAYYISSTTGTVAEATTSNNCPGHPTGGGNGGSGGSEIAANTPIQNITQAQCQALPVFTGTNDAQAVKTVTDNRGGTTRTYRIAKLADNNCWMLDNLMLGSSGATTTLTPSDSNVAANFTLPRVQTAGSASPDNPTVSGRVPGDTGSGATNYGYLYNWPAATAGETQASITSGNATHSICAKGWRLPTGGNTGEFAMLNAKMNNPAATSPSTSSGTGYYQNWLYSGQFKGVLAGGWWSPGGFYSPGVLGALWSSSADPDWSDGALNATFNPSNVYPGVGNGYREHGLGVRCLLN